MLDYFLMLSSGVIKLHHFLLPFLPAAPVSYPIQISPHIRTFYLAVSLGSKFNQTALGCHQYESANY